MIDPDDDPDAFLESLLRDPLEAKERVVTHVAIPRTTMPMAKAALGGPNVVRTNRGNEFVPTLRAHDVLPSRVAVSSVRINADRTNRVMVVLTLNEATALAKLHPGDEQAAIDGMAKIRHAAGTE